MTAISLGTDEVLGDFIKTNIVMIDSDQKLQRTLQPDVQAPDTRRFDGHAVIEITQRLAVTIENCLQVPEFSE